ncbi:MAG: RpiB/LacA/LacB family sugar-phosphate isomerase [Candidatus Wildermuthbacteria bacterium]|nr:RpiB/LacA/LacB family sugar-phosphate isomerase [Candidatus Wildermuthbacteria bacterium]
MIYLGADHAGFELKEEIKKYLQKNGFEVEDMGAFALNPDDDYPDFVRPAAEAVALRWTQGKDDTLGIVLGGSGQGEAIAANKINGIRAVVYYGGPIDIVKLSRQHNNANILALGARFLSKNEALEAVKVWLETPFEGGRHERRLKKIEDLEA